MATTEHYLFVMWDGGGAVPPILGVAEKLIRSGKKISVLGERSMQPEVEAAGGAFIPYQYAPNRPDRRPESDPFPDWNGVSPFKVLHKLMYAHAAEYAKDVLECCEAHRFDKIVVDGFLIGAMVGAEAANLPYSVLWSALDPVPHPGRPPDGLGMRPGKNLLGKTRNKALNWVFLKILQSGRKLLNPLRKQYDLPPLSHPFDQYRNAEKVFLLSSAAFDYPQVQLPANTTFLGPQLNDPSWAPKLPVEVQEPYVLVSLGSTFQNQHALYQQLIDALQELPVPVVVTLGNVFEPDTFRTYPNIHILKAAAHEEVMPSCGLVVHHGGHGISLKSTLAGLPQLVIPLGRDQFGNAARIVYHGMGLQAAKKSTPKRLLQTARLLLSREEYGQAAVRMSRRIRDELSRQAPIEEVL